MMLLYTAACGWQPDRSIASKVSRAAHLQQATPSVDKSMFQLAIVHGRKLMRCKTLNASLPCHKVGMRSHEYRARVRANSPLAALLVCPDQIGKGHSISLAVVLRHAVKHDAGLGILPAMRARRDHRVEDGSIRLHVLHQRLRLSASHSAVTRSQSHHLYILKADVHSCTPC